MKKGDRRDLIIGILVLVIIALILIMIYTLVLKPSITKNLAEKYNEAYNKGVENTVLYLWNTISTNGYAEVKNGNESMILVPYEGSYTPTAESD